MAAESTIKNQIKAELDELVTATTLAAATISDIRKNPLDEAAPYPHAFLMPSAIESEILDNRNITRTYTFTIMVVSKAEDITSTTQIEVLREAILDKFDNNPNLDNLAEGGITPLSSGIEPYQHQNVNLIIFDVILKITTVKLLTF